MKTKFSLAVLCLSALAGSLQAATTNTITVKANPTAAGEVTGGGPCAQGSTARVTATAGDCYVFADWTVAGQSEKIVNNPYSFTVTGNKTLTANFAQLKYAISTSSFPENAGTITGGGNIGCGDTATLTAKANTSDGFAFTGWTSTLEAPSTNSKISFTVSGNESFVAHFKDVQAPKITITAPAKNAAVTTSAFLIEGTAKDNVGVEAVYYNLNGSGWQLASTADGFVTWYAFVTLPPNTSNNTVSAYAVDSSRNDSLTNGPVTFKCTAPGYAPLSIAEQLATITPGTSEEDSFQVSFDSAAYVLISGSIGNGGEVGTYTYTPTGPDTAELVPQRALPTHAGTNTDVLELTFTNAYNATYTETGSSGGTIQFAPTIDSVPPSLDGATIIESSFATSNYVATNVFSSGTFTEADSFAGSSSGSYTFTPFTPVAGLLASVSAGPTTNYTILSFIEGATSPSGNYFSEILDGTNVVSADVGSFTASTNAVSTKFVGPPTLAGLQATIIPTVEPVKGFSFTRTFGRGTFASMYVPPGTNFALFADGPNDAGIHLGNPRVTTNTGVAAIMALAPPYAVGVDDDTVDMAWKTASSATSTSVNTGETASLAFKPLKQNAPPALTGMVMTVTSVGTTKTTTFTFNYNNVVAGGEEAGLSGSYTYAPYTPTMALVRMTATNAANAGEVQYLLLNFTSTSGGPYVGSRFLGTWELRPGAFKLAK